MKNKKLTIKLNQEAVFNSRENYICYCVKCGAERSDTEPDAREYRCDECGERTVFGIDSLYVIWKAVAELYFRKGYKMLRKSLRDGKVVSFTRHVLVGRESNDSGEN